MTCIKGGFACLQLIFSVKLRFSLKILCFLFKIKPEYRSLRLKFGLVPTFKSYFRLKNKTKTAIFNEIHFGHEFATCGHNFGLNLTLNLGAVTGPYLSQIVALARFGSPGRNRSSKSSNLWSSCAQFAANLVDLPVVFGQNCSSHTKKKSK